MAAAANDPRRDLVLVLDFGSQTTQLIARRIRECHVYCEIHPPDVPLERVRAMAPRAIVLSGGPASVYAPGAPSVDPALFDLGVPVLGICYGMQLAARLLGGRVERAEAREYGPADLHVQEATGIFAGLRAGESIAVWASHGDRVASLPPGFRVVGSTPNAPLCAVADPARGLYGVQFHPEVAHTPRGGEILRAFLYDVARLRPSWTPGSFVEQAVAAVASRVGPEERAICGLSGGVDSSVAALLCHRALGDRLTCVFVDNGLLRQGEAEQVVHLFRDSFHMPLVHVDAGERFLGALAGVGDPEAKRRAIGRVFVEVFEEQAARAGRVRWLIQGTLYPDVIESRSARGPSATIKTHHNVGGLPERMRLGLIEPLRDLFKDEVREVGAALGLPRELLWRHPFPGPGLAVRCVGEVTAARLGALRRAEAIVDEEVRAAGLYDALWQVFAVLLPVRSVGVMGDERTYGETVAVRAVRSTDAMTADWARLPHDLLARLSSRIANEVEGVSRVVYDISSKPPATIEWE